MNSDFKEVIFTDEAQRALSKEWYGDENFSDNDEVQFNTAVRDGKAMLGSEKVYVQMGLDGDLAVYRDSDLADMRVLCSVPVQKYSLGENGLIKLTTNWKSKEDLLISAAEFDAATGGKRGWE